MNCISINSRGMLLGVSDLVEFDTKKIVGAKLDVGSRTESGKFVTVTIKVTDAKVEDFTSVLDEIVDIQLENVIISSYLNSGRAQLSIKAQKAIVTVL